MPRGVTHLRQLTIRGFDKELERRIRELARREKVALNQAALRLLRRGAGLDEPTDEPPNVVGSSLDSFIGTWTAAEARVIERATEDLERVDPNLWR